MCSGGDLSHRLKMLFVFFMYATISLAFGPADLQLVCDGNLLHGYLVTFLTRERQ